MCTGDNIDTATAISLNAGIVSQQDIEDGKKGKGADGLDDEGNVKNYVCMTGERFREVVGGIHSEVTKDKDGKILFQNDTVKNMKAFREVEQ
jgi:magnesium-transporting ATPase (P-type)